MGSLLLIKSRRQQAKFIERPAHPAQQNGEDESFTFNFSLLAGRSFLTFLFLTFEMAALNLCAWFECYTITLSIEAMESTLAPPTLSKGRREKCTFRVSQSIVCVRVSLSSAAI